MNLFEQSLKMILLLIQDIEPITYEIIYEKLDYVMTFYRNMYRSIKFDEEKLLREVLRLCNTWIGEETQLTDNTNHIVWLPDKKAKISWKYWNRYDDYLRNVKRFPPSVVTRLNLLTDNILGNLEDPARKGVWDRRGMVVGQVQSGKTSNYTGLICKAADAGYKLILVLAGMHNNLRSQTQIRLDEGFLGFDSQISKQFDERKSIVIGVGKLKGYEHLSPLSLTNSSESGDFRHKNAIVRPGGPNSILVVVKKNKSVLQNLLNWIQAWETQISETGEVFINDYPVLVIDDEADNASLDANPKGSNDYEYDEYEPTAINRLIRQILKTFKKSAYVGYTATPFANIFALPPNENMEKSKYGEDLFPRSFIINLPIPSNYIGPVQVFGLDEDPENRIKGEKGYPIIRTINDYEDFIPSKHKKDFEPDVLPASLKEAIKAFILSCAVRLCRGQGNEHNSMLVHVTRMNITQMAVKELIYTELDYLKKQLEFGSGNMQISLMDELKELWEADYVKTTSEIIELVDDSLIIQIKWNEVKGHLYEAAAKIQVRAINGTAGDILDYRKYQNGLSVIAVGGDKLSRGLTLEGLTVSYYLRTSHMYDTLMQMGRWFGYRPGYLDLCRLYTSEELIGWYQFIAKADEELRKEFDFMFASGGTPMDYGLKVRTHPDGLQITSSNKMKSGMKMKVSFSGSLSQTVFFHRNEEIARNNLQTVENWIRSIGINDYYRTTKNYGVDGISGKKIIELLDNFVVHPQSRSADPSNLSKYIQQQMKHGELVDWTVILISSQRPKNRYTIAGLNIGLIQRNDKKSDDDEVWMITKSQIISPRDEHIDLDDSVVQQALQQTKEVWMKKNLGKGDEPKTPNGSFIRAYRPVKKGLLLLYPLDYQITNQFATIPIMGFAISFPKSDNVEEVEYMVDQVYLKNLYGDDE